MDVGGLSKLSEFGLLGTLLAIALGAVIWLYGRQNALWGDRLQDWKASQEIQQAQTAKISELSATSEQRTRAQEEAARAMQLLAQTNAQFGGEISRIREELSNLRSEISGLRQESNRIASICAKWEQRP